MPSIINLKFKGNKSFVAFSNLNDNEALTKTWKVCTKVASYLEQGQRLENLSWRLWHLQNLMVDTDNAKSKREFKKLSKSMSDKLDKEKGRSIEELEAPDYKRTASTEMIHQRAIERERSREASSRGPLKRLQYTFSVDHPIEAVPDASVQKPDLKPSQEFMQRKSSAIHVSLPKTPTNVHPNHEDSDDMEVEPASTVQSQQQQQQQPSYLHFPSLFSNDFGPAAMLFPTPSRSSGMTYGEDITLTTSVTPNDGFGVIRPTIELPLDELITTADSPDSSLWYPSASEFDSSPDPPSVSSHPPPGLPIHQQQQHHSISSHSHHIQQPQQPEPRVMTVQPVSLVAPRHLTMMNTMSSSNDSDLDDSNESDDADSDYQVRRRPYASTSSHRTSTKGRSARSRPFRSNTPTNRPHLTVKTSAGSVNRPGATATNPPATARGANPHNNTAPGGAKAECQNCGATHTPLWRRGLNDELNCNACGLYCKLHKRPRPKTMRNSHGEGKAQTTPRNESVDVMAQCYNCHTTATPLWRKDDEGKTVCNACGLYFKLHGSARPISMKSDVIRKRSRHDARRVNQQQAAVEETPSASPGLSGRTSPATHEQTPPTFVPDSSTNQMHTYDLSDFPSGGSELLGALGHFSQFQFPGPLHPDVIMNHYPTPVDALPFASMDTTSDAEPVQTSPRVNKRRRMSTDSASEPPSSAVSYSSYNSGYSSATSSVASHSQRSSMDFNFAGFPTFGRGQQGNATFWHPPMMPQAHDSPMYHPPMLPPNENESPMDYLHPPMLLPQEDEALFSSFIHPPMSLPEEASNHPPVWPSDFDFDAAMRVGGY